jgi:hypothetical protein
MRLKIQVEVSMVVTPCNVVVGYRRFGGQCCLQIQGDSRVVSYQNTTEDLDLNVLYYTSTQ